MNKQCVQRVGVWILAAGLFFSPLNMFAQTQQKPLLANPEQVSVSGLSFAMGRKLKLNEAFFRSHALKPDQVVRIHLANRKTVEVETSGIVYVYVKGSNKKIAVEGASTLTATLKNGEIQLLGIQSTDPVLIDPHLNTTLTFDGNIYTGVLYLIPRKDGTIMVLEYNNLEDYLFGVVGFEMSPSWPIEALKAQAVVARTYARFKMAKKEPNFDLDDTPSDQIYKGSASKIYKAIWGRLIRRVVQETKGQVLMYNGKLLEVFYSANCGGYTENGQLLIGEYRQCPEPLRGVACDTCAGTGNSCWKASIPGSTITSFVQKHSDLSGPVINIKIDQREKAVQCPSDRVKRVVTLQFETANGVAILDCESFKRAVGWATLKSCKIEKIEKAADNTFVFSGCGFGHGVGMCQDGAKGMAKQKKTYKEILKFYFPYSKIEEM